MTRFNDEQIALRLPGPLLERIDREHEALRQKYPRRNVSRAETIRILLTRGLKLTGAALSAEEDP